MTLNFSLNPDAPRRACGPSFVPESRIRRHLRNGFAAGLSTRLPFRKSDVATKNDRWSGAGSPLWLIPTSC
jgi:hypothetical protein